MENRETEYRPNQIHPSQIKGYLKTVHAFLQRSEVRRALESTTYRLREFKHHPSFQQATDHYIALDETGKAYAEMSGNNKTYWWLSEISEAANALMFITKGRARRNEILDMGRYEFAPSEISVEGLTVHFAQLLRSITSKVSESLDEESEPTGMVDTIHFVYSHEDPEFTPPADWTNGYSRAQVQKFFRLHQDERVARKCRSMTMGTQWAHSKAHQKASKLADEHLPNSLLNTGPHLRSSIHAQVGGVEELRNGRTPVFFGDLHSYQLSKSYREGGPQIRLSPNGCRMQIVNARQQIHAMLTEGPPM